MSEEHNPKIEAMKTTDAEAFFLNYDQWLYQALNDVTVYGAPMNNTKELCFTHMQNMFPRNRYCLNEERKHNIFALLAETVWVLAGSRSVDWLERFLPRAPDFSDDGKVWRAGYGPRIRSWGGDQGVNIGYVDQIHYVYRQLMDTPTTRQAVISIWDPHQEIPAVGFTKDMPCNNWIHFLNRDDALYMHVVVRSQDLVWGNMINFFEWSMLQEILASMLGINVGMMKMSIDSMHIYDHHFPRCNKIMEWYEDNIAKVTYDLEVKPSFEQLDMEEFSDLFDFLFKFENVLCIEADDQSALYMSEQLKIWQQWYHKYPILVGTFSWIYCYERFRGPAETIRKILVADADFLDQNLMTNINRYYADE